MANPFHHHVKKLLKARKAGRKKAKLHTHVKKALSKKPP